MIEPHRLVVEERRVERRRMMDAQVRARVGEQREAARVALRKAVERERGDRVNDLFRGVAVNPAVTIAIRKSCSWNSGTPRVRRRIGSRLGCGYVTGSRPRRRRM